MDAEPERADLHTMSDTNQTVRCIALRSVASLLMAGWASESRGGGNGEVDYPSLYRSWTHVKSAVIGPANPAYERYGGIHHIYANDNAMEGYRTGQFPDGAVIVFDLLQANETAGMTVEGPRKFIDVMAKDSKRFASSAGWGYEEFKGDSTSERPLSEQARTACYLCHARQLGRDSVFSVFRK